MATFRRADGEELLIPSIERKSEPMDTGFAGENSPLATIYRLSSARLRALLLLYACNLMWNGLVILVLFLMFRREPGWEIYSISLVSLFAIWHTLRLLAWIRIRLVTSPAGIAYIGPGYRLFTTWENIVGMGEVKVLPYGRPGFRRLMACHLHRNLHQLFMAHPLLDLLILMGLLRIQHCQRLLTRCHQSPPLALTRLVQVLLLLSHQPPGQAHLLPLHLKARGKEASSR